MDLSSASLLSVENAPPVDGCLDSHRSLDAERRTRRMVDEHFELVWRSLRRFGVEPGSVDDAAQRVFWIAARKLDQIPPRSERAFLLGTAARVASDIRRVQKRNSDREGTDNFEDYAFEAPSPDELLDTKRARELLDKLLDSMPEDIRTVFVLAEAEGCTSAEIAEHLDIPTGTVASRLRRGRELFKLGVERIRMRMQHQGGGK